MERQQAATVSMRTLIPWDGLTPIDQVLTFARSLGGQDATLVVLPVTPESMHEDPFCGRSPGRAAMDPPVEVLDFPDFAMDPSWAITAVASARAIDLILMATPCQASSELDPSCLAARIALDSPIPVMVVHFTCDDIAAFPPSITRLLIPLDGSARAAQVLPFAASVAQHLGVPVQQVLVIDPARVLPPAYAYDPYATQEAIAGLKHDAHWALSQGERMLKAAQVDVRSELLYGSVIPSLEATVEPGDVIVMTTHGVGSAPGGRLGSVAARLLAEVPGPLIIMRGTPLSEVVNGNMQAGRYEPISRPTA